MKDSWWPGMSKPKKTSRLVRFAFTAAEIAFYAFLAAYWYLVHSLYPEYALIAAVLAYAVFAGLRPRVPNAIASTIPQALLLLLSAILFYALLNPLPNLYGVSQLAWFTLYAIGFRCLFASLTSATWKSGALLLSYGFFLALPLGMPRITPTVPVVPTSHEGQEAGTLDVAIVGAGFGGIAMGKELLDAGLNNFRIYEGADEVGGTWWHNRYPGLHVDVQSALYSLSYFPNPKWSKLWAPRKELRDYSQRLVDAVGVRPFIQFNTWVQGLSFDDNTQLWTLSLGGKQVQSRHVVLANGGLHIPNTPQFQGAERYEGTRFHSARWRDDVTLEGKRIAVIGSGASAVQIIPEIAKTAAKVDMYQRTPNWVSPQNNQEVPRFQQWVYQYVPLVYKLKRLLTHATGEIGFRAVFPSESRYRASLEEQLKDYIRTTVTDQSLHDKLIPDYEFGCKRPLVTQHFYPALNRANVEVITTGVDNITAQGIQDSEGNERAYDVIIMATGYKLSQLPFSISGRNNQLLEEKWQEKPEAYRTMMVNGFPNFYLLSGPNSGFLGSYIIHIESAAGYLAQVIRKGAGSHLIEPTVQAEQTFNRELQADLRKTVWAGRCKSWYKLDNGHVIANHPHPVSRVIYERSRPRWDDFLLSERRQAKPNE